MIAFDNSYTALPPKFFRRVMPTSVSAPQLICFNTELAEELGLDINALGGPDAAEIWSGNRPLPNSDPIATVYAAHQFGNFVPQLGDGRAILLGEVIDRNGQRRDIQLKGAGPTPFSRNGDGRSALGPVLREYLVSEAMHAFGIPTTRALAATLTGEDVYRETVLPGGVLARVAASHIRIGTFQFFAARGDIDGLRELADHAIARHYPECAAAENRALALLSGVMQRQARLVARWLSIGFIHGVMNTDNMTISGETLDFGPCAFLDEYNPGKVFSSIDRQGRYAYANQPAIAQWNLARLAETLLPLIDDDADKAVTLATAELDRFASLFNDEWLKVMRAKLGLVTARDEDEALIRWLMSLMQEAGSDFTLTFHGLSKAVTGRDHEADLRAELRAVPAGSDWINAWRERLAMEPDDDAARRSVMRLANPAVIPRNHRIEEVIVAGVAGDFAPFAAMNAALSRPFDDRPELGFYQTPPREDERITKTFCGT